MSTTTAGVRKVDRNGMRGGAAISAIALLFAFLVSWEPILPVMGAVLGIGSLFGLRYSPLGATYRAIKKTLNLDIRVEPEDEPPPRFAQTLGFVVLGLATLLWAVGASAWAWGFGLVVAALQILLASTGLCVGCEIYLFVKRLGAKGA